MKLKFAAVLLAASFLNSASALAEMVWNRGANSDVQSLDPHKTSTVEEFNILNDLYMGLMTSDAKGDIMPGAATSYTVSADGKTYVFKLREGAVWSDDSPVTAEDFVASWQRLVTPATGSEYASMSYPILNAEDIVGGKKKPDELAVKAVDASTLEVTLKGPTPYFLEMLTHQVMFPVHRAALAKFGDDFSKPGNMISNGAFTLAENKPNDRIRVVKNPKFYDAANVKLDAVNFIPLEDRGAAVKRFEAGEVDSLNDFPTEQLKELQAKFGEQLSLTPQLGTYYYVFKHKNKPWSDVAFRNAVAQVIDREYLAEKVWGNAMIPAYSFVPPGIAGYTPSMAEFAKTNQLDREDAAKKVFEAAGVSTKTPLKVELRYNTSENHKNTAVAVQDMLKPFGFDITLVNADGSAHYSHLEQKGAFDMARAGWVADYKDPVTFLNLAASGDGNNYGEYSNPEYDKLLSAASTEADPKKRMDLLAQAEAIMVKDQGILSLLYYANHNLVSSKLKGYVHNVMDKHPSRFVSKE
jgi:oligopeptide transport system substrate-binding protein